MRTRARLVEAAVEVFAETGYQQSTMDDIANRAGVAHGTVYRYFGNKEAVLYALVAERLTALAAEMHDALIDPTEESLTLAIRQYLVHVSSNRHLARIWTELSASRSQAAELRLRLRAPFIEAIATQVRHAQLDGSLPIWVDAEVAARAVGGMVDNFAYVWFVLEDRTSDDAELDRLASTLAIMWGGALGTAYKAAPPDSGGAAVRRLHAATGP
jgi:AcrR family transcriptional regulator